MQIADFLNPKLSWVMDAQESRNRLLEEISRRVGAVVPAINSQRLYQALLARETQGTTATPEGVALPHAMLEGLGESFIIAALVRGGVTFGGFPQRQVDLVFTLVGPQERAWEHIRLLARLARICHGPGALEGLRSAAGGEDLHRILLAEDQRYA